jgi:hypothetical protein
MAGTSEECQGLEHLDAQLKVASGEVLYLKYSLISYFQSLTSTGARSDSGMWSPGDLPVHCGVPWPLPRVYA